MAPSAFGAMNSCTALASDTGFQSSTKGLFALDTDKNFEISAEEFESGCGASDASVKEAIFASLDSEGARFGDDAAAMNNMETLLLKYEVKSGMNYTDSFDTFREIAKTVRLPRSLSGDSKISLGVIQESRHFEPHMNWPYPDRILRRHTEDLPQTFGNFDSLYGPEHTLIDQVCSGNTVSDNVISAFSNDTVVKDVYELSSLFSSCSKSTSPGPATVTYLFESYSAHNCPEEWQGKFISRTQTQIPQGFSDERDPDFTFLDHYTGKERNYGSDYKQSADDIPPMAIGTYKSRKLRLGAALVCDGMMSIEELSKSMCNHSVEKMKAAEGIDASNKQSCKVTKSKKSSKKSPKGQKHQLRTRE
jgi:hypothetical protein